MQANTSDGACILQASMGVRAQHHSTAPDMLLLRF